MVAAPDFGKTVRNVKRHGEILSILARHGFQDFLSETGLGRFGRFGRPKPGVEKISRGERLRHALEDLGPTFIKVGQVLSVRPDLIPAEWAEELSQLQDDCPRVPFEEIREALDRELPGMVDVYFSHIDPEPLAAASMAQVHRATLSSGEPVVVKCLRPGIRQLVETDLEVLRGIAGFVENQFENLGYSPTEVVQELERSLQLELDLGHEARATERLQRAFDGNPNVSFPRIFRHACSKSVITMEEVHGTLLSQAEADSFTPEERRKIVENCADAVFRMCLELGFFHADPHPGNVFAQPGGRITFIDCGMTGHIDARTRNDLADLVMGVTDGDLERVIRVISSMTDIDPSKADSRSFRSDVWDFVSRFHQDGGLESLDLGSMLQTFFQRLRRHDIRCPGDIVFLIKALSTLEGVAEEIDPNFDVVSRVAPQVRKLVLSRYGLTAIGHRLQATLLEYAELAEDLPIRLQSLLDQLRRNDFSISLEHRRLERMTDTIEHASRNVAHALIIAGLVVSSSILVLSDPAGGAVSIFGKLGLVLATGLSALLFVTNLRRR